MAVLWAVDHFRPYVWGRRFTLISDCSTLTWLFKSRDLSFKLNRWALRLIEYDMDLQWRPGTRHQLPDALSRLPCTDSPGEDIDEAFPDDTSSRQAHRGPEGPVLDGVPLKELGADQLDEPTAESMVAVAGTAITPEGVTDSVEGAAQIMLCPRSSKPRTEDNRFGMGDGESFQGLASLEEIGGVTKAVTRALSRARSQSLPAPTPQQPPQQTQPMEEDSTFGRRGSAAEDNRQNRTHPIILAETADTLQNS